MAKAQNAPGNERRTLWIVLLLNAAIAAGFFATGLLGDSSALIANGIDNLSDTAVYGLSLVALSRGQAWKTRAASISGVMLLLFAGGIGRADFLDLRKRSSMIMPASPPGRASGRDKLART
jgi:Co/Zn/Cd efflux system component